MVEGSMIEYSRPGSELRPSFPIDLMSRTAQHDTPLTSIMYRTHLWSYHSIKPLITTFSVYSSRCPQIVSSSHTQTP
jgi:hypothetical protein